MNPGRNPKVGAVLAGVVALLLLLGSLLGQLLSPPQPAPGPYTPYEDTPGWHDECEWGTNSFSGQEQWVCVQVRD